MSDHMTTACTKNRAADRKTRQPNTIVESNLTAHKYDALLWPNETN